MLKTLATILFAVLVSANLGSAAPPTSLSAQDETSPLSKTQLKRAVSAALQAEARERRQLKLSDGGAANQAYAQAVLRLCDVFAEIRGDQRYGDSEMLQKLVITLRHRLLDVARNLENKLQRSELPRPAWLATTSAAIRRTADPTSPSPANESVSSLPESGAAAGGGMIDNGWQLVELIQQTIEPGFWDTTGGPGTIYYFALKRALVVRATSEVHADLGNSLQQLKRN